jgi:hypothetical protein
VIANGEIGLLQETMSDWSLKFYRMLKGFSSVFDPRNVKIVAIPVIKKGVKNHEKLKAHKRPMEDMG